MHSPNESTTYEKREQNKNIWWFSIVVCKIHARNVCVIKYDERKKHKEREGEMPLRSFTKTIAVCIQISFECPVKVCLCIESKYTTFSPNLACDCLFLFRFLWLLSFEMNFLIGLCMKRTNAHKQIKLT